MPYDVFISYAQDDKRKADGLSTALENRDRSAFFAPRSIPPGALFPPKLRDAMQSSRMTAILLSSATEEAYFQCCEILAAIQLMRKRSHVVVPIYLDPDCRARFIELLPVQGIHWTSHMDPDDIAMKLCRILDDPPPQQGVPGIAPRAEVFGDRKLSGQVFAAELLTASSFAVRGLRAAVRP